MVEKSFLALIALLSMALFTGAYSAQAAAPIENAAIILDEEAAAIIEDSKADYAAKEIDGLPQLDFSTYSSQIFWLLVTFFLLYGIFASKTLPDISKNVESRKTAIQSDLETAEKLTLEADATQQAYQDKMQGAHQAASQTMRETEEHIINRQEQVLADFKARMDQEVQFTEERIAQATDKAMEDMNKVVSDVTQEIVQSITHQQPDLNIVSDTVANLNNKPKGKAA